MHKAEQLYYFETFDTFKTNIKNTWKTIKLILNKNGSPHLPDNFNINNNSVTDKSVIAQKFNEYFINIGPTLTEKIPPTNTSFTIYLTGNYPNSFMLFDTTPDEVIQVANQMQSKQSAGFDDIPLDIMKLSVGYLAKPLTEIINNSFRKGSFPNLLNFAKVCPHIKVVIHRNLLTTGLYLYYPVFLKYLSD